MFVDYTFLTLAWSHNISDKRPVPSTWTQLTFLAHQCHKFFHLSRGGDNAEKDLIQYNMIIIVRRIAFKAAVRFFKSPHCVANCLQHVRSRDPGVIVCKSRATRRALFMCNMCCVTSGSKGLFFCCLMSQQRASVSQGRICTEKFTCCHTEIEVADQTFYLIQSVY